MPLKRPNSLRGRKLHAERNLKEKRDLKTSKQNGDYLTPGGGKEAIEEGDK